MIYDSKACVLPLFNVVLAVARAMGGSMPFQDALKARLDLMTPSKAIVERCLREHPPRLSPGAFRAFVRGDIYLCTLRNSRSAGEKLCVFSFCFWEDDEVISSRDRM